MTAFLDSWSLQLRLERVDDGIFGLLESSATQ